MPLTSGLWVRNSQAEARAHPELREKLKIKLRHSPEKVTLRRVNVTLTPKLTLNQ